MISLKTHYLSQPTIKVAAVDVCQMYCAIHDNLVSYLKPWVVIYKQKRVVQIATQAIIIASVIIIQYTARAPLQAIYSSHFSSSPKHPRNVHAAQ